MVGEREKNDEKSFSMRLIPEFSLVPLPDSLSHSLSLPPVDVTLLFVSVISSLPLEGGGGGESSSPPFFTTESLVFKGLSFT